MSSMPNKQAEEYEEVPGKDFEESSFFAFNDDNDSFKGILLGRHSAINKKSGKKGLVFSFRDGDGVKWSINGSADLLPKLSRIPRGTKVEIIWTGEIKKVSAGDMKIFSVRIPKGTKLLPEEEIPF